MTRTSPGYYCDDVELFWGLDYVRFLALTGEKKVVCRRFAPVNTIGTDETDKSIEISGGLKKQSPKRNTYIYLVPIAAGDNVISRAVWTDKHVSNAEYFVSLAFRWQGAVGEYKGCLLYIGTQSPEWMNIDGIVGWRRAEASFSDTKLHFASINNSL